MDISSLREDYSKAELLENIVLEQPFLQFKKWFEEALKSNVLEPNAMHLSTVGLDLKPSGRIVLLKYYDEQIGYSFFTNYKSKKGKELEINPFAALTFFWPELERQIRIEGSVVKMNELESQKYFEIRPRKSQIGALASPQSEQVASRGILENQFEYYEKIYENQPIPKPESWGGYTLIPDYFEFWQGRRSRLHDRIIYSKNEKLEWEIRRLAP
ncbi:MAG: pyridoxamine 5'-phosphate oxidase [Bacteroidota bacterium]